MKIITEDVLIIGVSSEQGCLWIPAKKVQFSEGLFAELEKIEPPTGRGAGDYAKLPTEKVRTRFRRTMLHRGLTFVVIKGCFRCLPRDVGSSDHLT